jgi:hypothetical protein
MDTTPAPLASNPPPAAGMKYFHPTFGDVRLIKPAGGYSWHCARPSNPNHRLILNPKQMTRLD